MVPNFMQRFAVAGRTSRPILLFHQSVFSKKAYYLMRFDQKLPIEQPSVR